MRQFLFFLALILSTAFVQAVPFAIPSESGLDEPRIEQPVFRNCLTAEQNAKSPIYVNISSIKVNDGRIYLGKPLNLTADVDVNSAVVPMIDKSKLHLVVDAGQLGAIAGVNFNGDLCEAMVVFGSPQRCPFPGGFYKDLVFTQYDVPYFPGGIFIRSIKINLKIYQMINGQYTSQSPLWSCFEATVPVKG